MICKLRAGESPKEIAFSLGISHSAVKMIMSRNAHVRTVFVETHSLRHPDVPAPPPKIVEPLRRIVT